MSQINRRFSYYDQENSYQNFMRQNVHLHNAPPTTFPIGIPHYPISYAPRLTQPSMLASELQSTALSYSPYRFPYDGNSFLGNSYHHVQQPIPIKNDTFQLKRGQESLYPPSLQSVDRNFNTVEHTRCYSESSKGSKKHKELSFVERSISGEKNNHLVNTASKKKTSEPPPISGQTEETSHREFISNPKTDGSSSMMYPAHFLKGSIIMLAEGQLKRVEDMKTEDFLECAKRSPNLKIDSSTVVRITERENLSVLSFSVGPRKIEVTVEATFEHPFFVFGQGWSSCSPQKTLLRYGLECKKLVVGDICISLTHKHDAVKPICKRSLMNVGVNQKRLILDRMKMSKSVPVSEHISNDPHKKRRWSSPEDIVE